MHHTRSILATLCLFAALAPVVRAAEPELADKPVLKNGCSIQFPKNWGTDSVAGAAAFVFATAPTPDVHGGQEQAATLNISRIALAKADLMALAKDYQTRMAKDAQAQNYKAVDPPAEVNLNGAKGVSFGGTYTAQGKNLRSRQWLVAAPGRVYILTLTALSTAWDTRLPAGQASVETFRVLDEKK